MKLSIIMPVYNENKNILEIIQKVMAIAVEKELIIVDDCSCDGTRETLSKINDRKIKIVFHGRNRGKGAAIKTGLSQANGDWVVIQDADLEYEPRDYLRLMRPIVDGKTEVVYGSRFLGGGFRSFSPLQLLANCLLTGLTDFLFLARLTDIETCYKMIPRTLMHELALESDGFEIEPEITAKILRRGISILEVPISYLGRNYHEGKKIKPKDGLITLLALIKHRVKSLS